MARSKTLISQYNQNLLHQAPPKFFFFFFKESELLPRTNPTMSSDRGPATPVGIGVTGTSGVNIVAKSPYRFRFSPSLGETPPRGFSPRRTLCSAYCARVCFKSSFVQKNLSSSGLGNALGGFGGKVGNSWALEGTNGGRGNRLKSRKWWMSF